MSKLNVEVLEEVETMLIEHFEARMKLTNNNIPYTSFAWTGSKEERLAIYRLGFADAVKAVELLKKSIKYNI